MTILWSSWEVFSYSGSAPSFQYLFSFLHILYSFAPTFSPRKSKPLSDSPEPSEVLKLNTLPTSKDKWYCLICYTCIQILELLVNNTNLRKNREKETKKKNWKIINSFLPGARAFHGSSNFSRTFENSAL